MKTCRSSLYGEEELCADNFVDICLSVVALALRKFREFLSSSIHCSAMPFGKSRSDRPYPYSASGIQFKGRLIGIGR
jgi:hypothetical protein